MDDFDAVEILILARETQAARRWATMLQSPRHRIWIAADDVPDPSRLDLVVTDQQPADQAEDDPAGARLSTLGAEVSDALGVIRIGTEGPADVRLPADVTERELRLACRLLAEVVRLRRKGQAQTRARERLAREALTDPLTGLPNRRAWDQSLRERLATVGNASGRLCLAVIDLDHFKRVNDVHGHAVGDEVLRQAGQVISGGLREDDFVARLGGDEFGLLFSVPDEPTARAVVDRVRRGLPSGLARAGAEVVTGSAGFELATATSPALPCSDRLFQAADTALREAKRQGRNRTVGHLAR